MLEAVAAHQPVRVGEIAPLLGLTKASAQRSLQTLAQAGWITPAGGEITRWMLSDHARFVLSSSRIDLGFRELALPIMRELRDRTRETVHLSVPSPEHSMVIIERAESRRSLRSTVAIGSTFPMVEVASGIAHLARLDSTRLDQALAAADAAAVAWSPAEVMAFVNEARATGVAIQPAPTRDIISLGAAIGPAHHPIAAIALLVPLSRFHADEQFNLTQLVKDAARSITDATAGVCPMNGVSGPAVIS